MGVFQLPAFHSDGRLRGSFVYMLLCQDAPGPIYVKVGLTDRPTKRLQALRNGCPVTPQRFAFCELRSRDRAKLVEDALLAAMVKWSAHGEWFCVPATDKAQFNLAWGGVFRAMSEPGWSLRWEQMAVQAYIADGARRKRLAQTLYMRRGKSYRDFVKAGGLK